MWKKELEECNIQRIGEKNFKSTGFSSSFFKSFNKREMRKFNMQVG
jgi:hypothetical protein